MSRQRESVRLFESDFLEKFSHVHPIIPLVLWIPVIGFMFYQGAFIHELQISSILVVAFLGLLFWTLFEYLLHRFVFHIHPEGYLQERFQYIMHGNHHDVPDDATRLVMPPFPAIVIASIMFGIFRLFLPLAWTEIFFAGFMIGYLCYDYVHFSVHHFTPRTRVGKFLKQYHMLHHFADHHSRWGVSSPLWDYVFQTSSPKRQVGRSAHGA